MRFWGEIQSIFRPKIRRKKGQVSLFEREKRDCSLRHLSYLVHFGAANRACSSNSWTAVFQLRGFCTLDLSLLLTFNTVTLHHVVVKRNPS